MIISIIHWRTAYALTGIALLAIPIMGCGNASLPTVSTVATSELAVDTFNEPSSAPIHANKIGALLVSHGSHSEQWRKMLLEIEEEVRDKVLDGDLIADIKSSFMEYTEPSIATRLKEFDHEGYTHVILVPILLTVSSHSFDDIPVIAGQKEDYQTLETLKLEGTDIYKPKANVTLAPLLDFPDALGKNITRRVQDQSVDCQNEGVVMVAYGSEPYDEEWKVLLEDVGNKVRAQTGIDASEYCWCGHIAKYQSKPTEQAIKNILRKKHTAIVIPVLVAVDENFQGKIIGEAIINHHDIHVKTLASRELVTTKWVMSILETLDEQDHYRSHDFPTPSKVKIYLDNGSVFVNLASGAGEYETVRRRPLFYQFNSLHLAPKKYWLAFSDLFCVSLLLICITGLFVLRGKNGITGRGSVLAGAGVAVPLFFLITV